MPVKFVDDINIPNLQWGPCISYFIILYKKCSDLWNLTNWIDYRSVSWFSTTANAMKHMWFTSALWVDTFVVDLIILFLGIPFLLIRLFDFLCDTMNLWFYFNNDPHKWFKNIDYVVRYMLEIWIERTWLCFMIYLMMIQILRIRRT